MLSVFLALAVCWVSGNLNGRFQHREEVVSQQLAILQGKPMYFDGGPGDLPEFHNRILMPSLIVASTRTGVGSAQQWFIVWRFVSAGIMFMVFLRLTQFASFEWQTIGVALLALVLVLSFGHPWEHPTDFPDVAFTAGFCALALANRHWALFFLALAAATNRESAAFAGVIWAFVHGRSAGRGFNWKEIVRGMLISVVTYAEVLLLRQLFGVPGSKQSQLLGIVHLPAVVAGFLQRPTPYAGPILLAAILAPIALLLMRCRASLQPAEHGLLAASCAVFGVSLVFGNLAELRVFLPVFTIHLYVITLAGSRSARRLP